MAKRIKTNGKAGIRKRVSNFRKNMDSLDDGFLKLLIRLSMKHEEPEIVINDNGEDKKNPFCFQI